jgi:hypothetical protein
MPRYGVNQSMLDAECKWVEWELEDKLVHSTNELRESLAEGRAKVSATEAGLRKTLAKLPDRERLALKSMLARDVFHVAVLYETFLRMSQVVQNATGAATKAPPEFDRGGDAAPPLVFHESLFD